MKLNIVSKCAHADGLPPLILSLYQPELRFRAMMNLLSRPNSPLILHTAQIIRQFRICREQRAKSKNLPDNSKPNIWNTNRIRMVFSVLMGRWLHGSRQRHWYLHIWLRSPSPIFALEKMQEMVRYRPVSLQRKQITRKPDFHSLKARRPWIRWRNICRCPTRCPKWITFSFSTLAEVRTNQWILNKSYNLFGNTISAMENWGLIVYGAGMLINENDTTLERRMSFFSVIAHELSHQWFGNIVSPKWWSVVWLNEGFAQFFQYIVIDLVCHRDDHTHSRLHFSFMEFHLWSTGLPRISNLRSICCWLCASTVPNRRGSQCIADDALRWRSRECAQFVWHHYLPEMYRRGESLSFFKV